MNMSEFLPHHHNNDEDIAQLKSTLDHMEDFQTVSDVFKLLSDSSRIRIFWLLCHCEECVTNISALMNMTSPAVSHHLRQLKDSGLIISRRDGKEVYYKAADTEESRLLHLSIEQIMEITCPEDLHRIPRTSGDETTMWQEDQIRTVQQIHQELTEHLDQRITIEELSKKYLMNPSTLKAVFKSVYGTSIAAHMREHRMERAAQLLTESQDSISDIARSVGYESQSKFSSAFRDYYGVLPSEYRRRKEEPEARTG